MPAMARMTSTCWTQQDLGAQPQTLAVLVLLVVKGVDIQMVVKQEQEVLARSRALARACGCSLTAQTAQVS